MEHNNFKKKFPKTIKVKTRSLSRRHNLSTSSNRPRAGIETRSFPDPNPIKMLKFLMLLVILALVVLLTSETAEAWGAPHWGLTDYGWLYRGYGRGAFIPRGYAILNR
jgi:hypothetical protein